MTSATGPSSHPEPEHHGINPLHQPDLDLTREALEKIVAEPVKPVWKIEQVKTPERLEWLAKRLAGVKEFSLDTETWGPPGERLDRDLCLIQIGIPKIIKGEVVSGQGRVYLIDAIELTKVQEKRAQVKGGPVLNPLAPLKEIMEREDVTKIIQHAQFESAQFRKYGIHIKAISDIEKLAKELRPDMYSYTLKANCQEILGSVLSKEEQTSDWHQRPLRREQIAYAALDAEWTMKLYEKLKEMDKAAHINTDLTIDQMFEEILEAAKKRDRFLQEAGIDRQYTIEGIRINNLLDAIKEKVDAMPVPTEKTVKLAGPFGTVERSATDQTELNSAKFRKLLPDIAEKLIIKTAAKGELEEALKREGLKGKEISEFMGKVYDVIGKTTSRLKILPKFKIDNTDADAIRTAAAIDPNLSIDQMLEQVIGSAKSRLELLRKAGIGNEFALETVKIARLEETIEDKLWESVSDENKTAKFDGAHGLAELTVRNATKLNVAKLEALRPDLAKQFVFETARKEDVANALEEKGFDPASTQNVIEGIYDVVKRNGHSTRIYPRYSLIYGHKEQDEVPGSATSDPVIH